jgi:putative hydrolase of the HAD superfamily
LSNTLWPRTHHQEVFERDNLANLIDESCYTSEMDVAKPHREAFMLIAAQLEVDPEQCVFVGDRIWDDVYGAQQVGMRAIWIPHSKVPSEHIPDGDAVPDAIANGLIEVLAIVRQWRSV